MGLSLSSQDGQWFYFLPFPFLYFVIFLGMSLYCLYNKKTIEEKKLFYFTHFSPLNIS